MNEDLKVVWANPEIDESDFVKTKELEKNILKILIGIVKQDHPEFEEEGTPGYDLILNAEAWLKQK